MQMRTDLAIEAREIAGERVAGMDFSEYRENGLKISRLDITAYGQKSTSKAGAW